MANPRRASDDSTSWKECRGCIDLLQPVFVVNEADQKIHANAHLLGATQRRPSAGKLDLLRHRESTVAFIRHAETSSISPTPQVPQDPRDHGVTSECARCTGSITPTGTELWIAAAILSDRSNAATMETLSIR